MGYTLNLFKQELENRKIFSTIVETATYRKDFPYLSIEVTQLFTRELSMIYNHNIWRSTKLPKEIGSLRTIDVSVNDSGEVNTSILIPCGGIGYFDENYSNTDTLFKIAETEMKIGISRANGIFSSIEIFDYCFNPGLFLSTRLANSSTLSPDFVELFALELLGIYESSSIITNKINERETRERPIREAKAKEECEKREKIRKQKEEQSRQWVSQGLCKNCGGKLGFFKKCKSCGTKN